MSKTRPSNLRKSVTYSEATSTDSEYEYESSSTLGNSVENSDKCGSDEEQFGTKTKLTPRLKRKLKRSVENRLMVARWLNKLRESDDLNSVFVQILGEIQENIIGHVKILEQNIKASLKQQIFTAVANSDKIYFNEQLDHLKQVLNMALPAEDIQDFIKFDESLRDDEEKLDAFRKIIKCITTGSSDIGFDINKSLHAVLSQTVRLGYSGAGRTYQGKKKRNFSATNVYKCIEDTLIEKYKGTTIELQIKSRISRWFSTRNYYC